MSEKVVIPKEVSEAIERLRRLGNSTRRIISATNGGTVGDNSAVLRSFVESGEDNFDKILTALVNGYTVEQTPEEKLRERYEHIRKAGRKDEYADGKADGFLETLNTLGLSIEGINA